MGWTPFYQTWNELEHIQLLMIEHKHLNFGLERMNIELDSPSLFLNHTSNRLEHNFFEHCSSFGNRTRTPYFWLWMIEHRTLNIVRPITTVDLWHISEVLPDRSSRKCNRKWPSCLVNSMFASSLLPFGNCPFFWTNKNTMYVIKLPFVTVRELGINLILQISDKSLERVLRKFEVHF